MFRFILLLALVVCPTTARAADTKPSEEQIHKWLRGLKPLQKVHYSWPLPFQDVPNTMLFEYARITHALSLSGEWTSPRDLERAVQACKLVNDTKPKIPASIGINFSMWHRRFGKDLPPTDTGPTHWAELAYLRQRLEFIRDAVKAANSRVQGTVSVTALLVDSERFHTKTNDTAWNKAMTAKYDTAHEIVRSIFPQARVDYYARGAWHPGASPSGWSEAKYFALDEKGDSFGCSLYNGPEIGYTREIFRRTAANAEKHGCSEVTPWIALGSGFRRQTTEYHEFSLNWNYDLIYSWKLGAEINVPWYGVVEREKRFAPWRKAKVAIFYPEPFGRSPYWIDHFVAYVRGANGNKELPTREEPKPPAPAPATLPQR
ncbi:MAG: hypothetical protein ACPGVU_12705 [Limisphaerales bacterium]